MLRGEEIDTRKQVQCAPSTSAVQCRCPSSVVCMSTAAPTPVGAPLGWRWDVRLIFQPCPYSVSFSTPSPSALSALHNTWLRHRPRPRETEIDASQSLESSVLRRQTSTTKTRVTYIQTYWAFTWYDRRTDRSDRLAEPPTSVNQINVAC